MPSAEKIHLGTAAVVDNVKYFQAINPEVLKRIQEENTKELQNLKLIVHKNWNSFKNAWFITENDLWEYFQIRFSKDDSVSRKIMDSITDD
jgi:hypothetical protein